MGLGFSALAPDDAPTYARRLQRVKIVGAGYGETIEEEGKDEEDAREA